MKNDEQDEGVSSFSWILKFLINKMLLKNKIQHFFN
jgi:hypothetical protein